ncbi:MAG: hypothetical protein IIY21_22215 [Clostridiales bacterium]|nr:hypothetical protein [Clostridiales bacterium]
MDQVLAVMLAAKSFERILNNILGTVIWAILPVTFLVFLVLFIIAVIQVKKKGAGKTKAVVFGCLSGYFLLGIIGEIVLFAMLASAIAHM